jgi:hypothetical protein
MPAFICAMAAGVAFSVATLAAQAPTDPSTAEISALAHQWEAAGNGAAGDPAVALVALTVEGPQVMQDNFPPFLWTGPGAMKAWLGDYVANVAREQDTETKTVVGAPSYVRSEGDRVYAAFPVTYTYKKAGTAVREDLVWSVIALRTAQGLKFESMAYGGGPGAAGALAKTAEASKPAKKSAFQICGWGMGCH